MYLCTPSLTYVSTRICPNCPICLSTNCLMCGYPIRSNDYSPRYRRDRKIRKYQNHNTNQLLWLLDSLLNLIVPH